MLKHHSFVRKISKLSLGTKALLLCIIGVILFLAATIVLGMNGISVVSFVMQYDKNGNSKWFLTEPTIQPLEVQPYSADIVIEHINKSRTEEGAAVLSEDDLLMKAADVKSQDMMSYNYFDYVGPDRKEWWAPITETGYAYNKADIAISQGYNFVTEVMDNWFKNEGIKKNLLDNTYKDIGVSVRTGTYLGEKSTLVVVYLADKQVKSANAPTTSSASKITCTGPDGKKFNTTQKECDDFNIKWGNVKKTVTPTVSLPLQTKPTYSNYTTITCVTVYGVYTSYGKDYADANTNCNNLKQYAQSLQNNIPTVYIPNVYVSPTSTPKPDYTEECNGIRSEWQSFKESFMANQYNNYNSSTDAVNALNAYMQTYQQSYQSYGCSGSLSLF